MNSNALSSKKNVFSAAILAVLVGAVFIGRLIRIPPTVWEIEPKKIEGPANAKITILEFSDFLCSYCQELQPILKQLLAHFPDLQIAYKHYSIVDPEKSETLAEAAECAADQGDFVSYRDALYERQDALFQSDHLEDDLLQLAKDRKMNVGAFKQCISSDTKLAVVRRNKQEGKRFFVEGTPALILNGNKILTARKFDDLKRAIELELKKGP